MLKANSKKAKENLYNYIREHSEDHLLIDWGYTPEQIESKKDLYKAIYNAFLVEKQPTCAYYSRYPEGKVFEEWASGLACGGLFCYYYNREPAADIAEILEETPEEVERYNNRSRSEQESFLTSLIYREISRA